MAGVIKKLYHPIDNGTVTTAVSQELQEVYPITATSGVYAPEGAFHANDSLDQILRWLDANKISGSGLKTLTVNGTENSLIGSGTIVINTGGGGGGSDSDFFELDASGNLHVKNDRGLWTGSFISAGGVGSGGGEGGSSTLAGLTDTEITNPTHPETLVYNNTLQKWVNRVNYRAVGTLDYSWTPGSQSGAHGALTSTTATTLNFWEGNGINITIDEAGQGTSVGTLRFHVKLQNDGGLAFNSNGELYSTGGSGPSEIPIATQQRLGGVKIGSGVNVAADGTISVNVGSGWMDLTTAQTVQGTAQAPALKTFVDGIAIGNNAKTITLVNGEIVINGDVKVNGNFYATGAVTAGA